MIFQVEGYTFDLSEMHKGVLESLWRGLYNYQSIFSLVMTLGTVNLSEALVYSISKWEPKYSAQGIALRDFKK